MSRLVRLGLAAAALAAVAVTAPASADSGPTCRLTVVEVAPGVFAPYVECRL